MFCFISPTKSVAQNITGITERHCLSKGILSQQRIGHLASGSQPGFHLQYSGASRADMFLNISLKRYFKNKPQTKWLWVPQIIFFICRVPKGRKGWEPLHYWALAEYIFRLWRRRHQRLFK